MSTITQAIDSVKLKKDLILVLEENFDPHLQRIDDDSLQILSIDHESSEDIVVNIVYREVFIRCCAGPSWESPIQEKIRLSFNGKRWMRSI